MLNSAPARRGEVNLMTAYPFRYDRHLLVQLSSPRPGLHLLNPVQEAFEDGELQDSSILRLLQVI